MKELVLLSVFTVIFNLGFGQNDSLIIENHLFIKKIVKDSTGHYGAVLIIVNGGSIQINSQEIAEAILYNKSFFIGVNCDSFVAIFGKSNYENNGYAFEEFLMTNEDEYSGCWLAVFGERVIVSMEVFCH